MMRILAVCGSLRTGSSNRAALDALALVAPAPMQVIQWDGLQDLPFFNPDLDDDRLPTAVAIWRRAVETHDAIVFCSPEYVGGIAGLLKNALEWLGGSTALYEKPVAVVNASPRARHADAALKLVLRTLSAKVIEEACIDLPLLGRSLNGSGIASDEALAQGLHHALGALQTAILNPGQPCARI